MNIHSNWTACLDDSKIEYLLARHSRDKWMNHLSTGCLLYTQLVRFINQSHSQLMFCSRILKWSEGWIFGFSFMLYHFPALLLTRSFYFAKEWRAFEVPLGVFTIRNRNRNWVLSTIAYSLIFTTIFNSKKVKRKCIFTTTTICIKSAIYIWWSIGNKPPFFRSYSMLWLLQF